METSGFQSLLRNRNFMLLWGEQILSQFAYNLVNYALLIWVFKISDSSFAESLLILSFILPTALFSGFTGVVADFFDRRKIMIIIHALWALLVLSFVIIKASFPLILFFSFVLNTIDRFFTPAEQASLPNIVKREELLLANSLFSFSMNAGFLVGFSLAGPLMLLFGNDFPFFTASFLAVLGLILIRFLPGLRPETERAGNWGKDALEITIAEIRKGYAFIKATKIIQYSIIIFTFLQIGMNTAMALSPSFVVHTLKFEDPKHASWVAMFPVGLGSIIAIALLRIWQHDLKRKLISRGMLLAGISMLGLGLTPFISSLLIRHRLFAHYHAVAHLNVIYPLTFIFCLFLGLSVTLMFVPTLTIISEYTPNEFLGRVWGVANLIQNTVAAIPLLLLGAIADKISVLPLIYGFAIFALFLYTLSYSAKIRSFLKTKEFMPGLSMFLPEIEKDK